MSRKFTTRVPGRPTAIARARRWTRATLDVLYADSGDEGEDVVLVVSELVTNSVNEHAGRVDLTVEGHQASVRIEVTDDISGIPTLKHAGPDMVRGRGLRVIDSLALEWGVQTRTPGKTVWAELPIRAAPARAHPAPHVGTAERRPHAPVASVSPSARRRYQANSDR
jgi:anti-sigma regulatory factor (Ser/Thr protein kinase)